jgi:serine/threonine protein kinase
MIGKLGEFFIWAAGGDRDQIDTRTERARYTGIGAAVVFTAVMAGISMALALSLTFGGSPIRFLPIAVLWGALIFNLDRMLVAAVSYGNLHRDPAEQSWSTWAAGKAHYLPRVLLAVVLGIVISEPIMLRLFDKEIEQQLDTVQARSLADIEREVRASPQFKQRGAQLTKREATAREDLRKAQQALNAAETALDDEISGRGGTGTVGDDRRAAERRLARDKAREARDWARDTLDTELPLIKAARDRLEGDIQNEITRRQRTVEANDGFLAREEALGQLMATHPGLRARRLFVAAMFLLVEALPVLLRLLSSESVHDLRVKLAARAKVAGAKASLEAEQARYASERDIQVAALAVQADVERHRNEARADVERARIDDWATRELRRIKEGHGATRRMDGPSLPVEDDEVFSVVVDLADDLQTVPMLPGETVLLEGGSYELVEEIVRTNRSSIYLALPCGERLFEGNIGTVVKILNSDEDLGSTEYRLMRWLHNHLIVDFITAGKVNGQPALAMRYYPRMSLDRYIFGQDREVLFTPRQLLGWTTDILNGLYSIWSYGVVHCDGKPANVLITGPLNDTDPENRSSSSDEQAPDCLKVCDFSESFRMRERTTSRPGWTPFYSPYEVLRWVEDPAGRHPPHSFQSDIASFLGGVGYFLASGGWPPYSYALNGTQPAHTLRALLDGDSQLLPQGHIRLMERGLTPLTTLNPICPEPIATMFTTWLSLDPDARVPGVDPADHHHLHSKLSRQIEQAKRECGESLDIQVFGRRHPEVPRPPAPVGYPPEYLKRLDRLTKGS